MHPATVPSSFSPPVVSGSYTPSNRHVAMASQGSFLRAAIYAGAIGFLLCLLPTGPIVALPIAGWLAVRFYARTGGFPLRAKAGFHLGALAGLSAFAVICVLGVAAMAALNARGELRQALLEIANRAHGINANVQPEQFVDSFLTPSGMTLAIVSSCVLFVLLAGLGGLISAAVQQRKPPQ